MSGHFTSGERRATIAVAIILVIAALILALHRGRFDPPAAAVASPTPHIQTAEKIEACSDSTSKVQHRKHSKKGIHKKKSHNAPVARERNPLDESISK